MKNIWPKKLNKGDTAALIAPSSPVGSHVLKDAVESLKFLGLVPKVFPSCHLRWGYLSGNDARRAEDFNRAFAANNVDAVFCLRGGYGAMRLLPMIDWDMISRNPKFFCGFSDITALHTVINQKCGFITLHSPMPSTGYHKMDSFSLFSLKNCLFGEPKSQIIENPPGFNLSFYYPSSESFLNDSFIVGKKISGTLCGGNLSLLQGTLGSPYEIDTAGKILFIEEVNEIPYKVDRTLTSLSLAGKFSQCKAVILGSFSGCTTGEIDSESTLPLSRIFMDIIYPFGRPVVSGFCAGHSYPQSTLPLGAEISIDTEEKTIEIL